jgi:hypothetical protein
MIIGNFYFKRTSSGNLLGEYTNKKNKEIYSESAILKSEKSNTFKGKYNTTWLEGNVGDSHTGILDISEAKGDKYDLTWSYSGAVQFWGQGFVVDDILIGFYVDEKL